MKTKKAHIDGQQLDSSIILEMELISNIYFLWLTWIPSETKKEHSHYDRS